MESEGETVIPEEGPATLVCVECNLPVARVLDMDKCRCLGCGRAWDNMETKLDLEGGMGGLKRA